MLRQLAERVGISQQADDNQQAHHQQPRPSQTNIDRNDEAPRRSRRSRGWTALGTYFRRSSPPDSVIDSSTESPTLSTRQGGGSHPPLVVFDEYDESQYPHLHTASHPSLHGNGHKPSSEQQPLGQDPQALGGGAWTASLLPPPPTPGQDSVTPPASSHPSNAHHNGTQPSFTPFSVLYPINPSYLVLTQQLARYINPSMVIPMLNQEVCLQRLLSVSQTDLVLNFPAATTISPCPQHDKQVQQQQQVQLQSLSPLLNDPLHVVDGANSISADAPPPPPPYGAAPPPAQQPPLQPSPPRLASFSSRAMNLMEPELLAPHHTLWSFCSNTIVITPGFVRQPSMYPLLLAKYIENPRVFLDAFYDSYYVLNAQHNAGIQSNPRNEHGLRGLLPLQQQPQGITPHDARTTATQPEPGQLSGVRHQFFMNPSQDSLPHPPHPAGSTTSPRYGQSNTDSSSSDNTNAPLETTTTSTTAPTGATGAGAAAVDEVRSTRHLISSVDHIISEIQSLAHTFESNFHDLLKVSSSVMPHNRPPTPPHLANGSPPIAAGQQHPLLTDVDVGSNSGGNTNSNSNSNSNSNTNTNSNTNSSRNSIPSPHASHTLSVSNPIQQQQQQQPALVSPVVPLETLLNTQQQLLWGREIFTVRSLINEPIGALPPSLHHHDHDHDHNHHVKTNMLNTQQSPTTPHSTFSIPKPLTNPVLKRITIIGIHGWKTFVHGLMSDYSGKPISEQLCEQAALALRETLLNQFVLDACKISLLHYTSRFLETADSGASPLPSSSSSDTCFPNLSTTAQPHNAKHDAIVKELSLQRHVLPCIRSILSHLGIDLQLIPLYSYGPIQTRVTEYTTVMLPPKHGIIRSSDLVIAVAHSQGCVVSAHVLRQLIESKVIIPNHHHKPTKPLQNGNTKHYPARQTVVMVNIAGVLHGPFSDLLSDFLPSTRELFRLARYNTDENKDAYDSFHFLHSHGVHMVNISAWGDAVVPTHSSLMLIPSSYSHHSQPPAMSTTTATSKGERDAPPPRPSNPPRKTTASKDAAKRVSPTEDGKKKTINSKRGLELTAGVSDITTMPASGQLSPQHDTIEDDSIHPHPHPHEIHTIPHHDEAYPPNGSDTDEQQHVITTPEPAPAKRLTSKRSTATTTKPKARRVRESSAHPMCGTVFRGIGVEIYRNQWNTPGVIGYDSDSPSTASIAHGKPPITTASQTISHTNPPVTNPGTTTQGTPTSGTIQDARDVRDAGDTVDGSTPSQGVSTEKSQLPQPTQMEQSGVDSPSSQGASMINAEDGHPPPATDASFSSTHQSACESGDKTSIGINNNTTATTATRHAIDASSVFYNLPTTTQRLLAPSLPRRSTAKPTPQSQQQQQQQQQQHAPIAATSARQDIHPHARAPPSSSTPGPASGEKAMAATASGAIDPPPKPGNPFVLLTSLALSAINTLCVFSSSYAPIIRANMLAGNPSSISPSSSSSLLSPTSLIGSVPLLPAQYHLLQQQYRDITDLITYYLTLAQHIITFSSNTTRGSLYGNTMHHSLIKEEQDVFKFAMEFTLYTFTQTMMNSRWQGDHDHQTSTHRPTPHVFKKIKDKYQPHEHDMHSLPEDGTPQYLQFTSDNRPRHISAHERLNQASLAVNLPEISPPFGGNDDQDDGDGGSDGESDGDTAQRDEESWLDDPHGPLTTQSPHCMSYESLVTFKSLYPNPSASRSGRQMEARNNGHGTKSPHLAEGGVSGTASGAAYALDPYTAKDLGSFSTSDALMASPRNIVSFITSVTMFVTLHKQVFHLLYYQTKPTYVTDEDQSIYGDYGSSMHQFPSQQHQHQQQFDNGQYSRQQKQEEDELKDVIRLCLSYLSQEYKQIASRHSASPLTPIDTLLLSPSPLSTQFPTLQSLNRQMWRSSLHNVFFDSYVVTPATCVTLQALDSQAQQGLATSTQTMQGLILFPSSGVPTTTTSHPDQQTTLSRSVVVRQHQTHSNHVLARLLNLIHPFQRLAFLSSYFPILIDSVIRTQYAPSTPPTTHLAIAAKIHAPQSQSQSQSQPQQPVLIPAMHIYPMSSLLRSYVFIRKIRCIIYCSFVVKTVMDYFHILQSKIALLSYFCYHRMAALRTLGKPRHLQDLPTNTFTEIKEPSIITYHSCMRILQSLPHINTHNLNIYDKYPALTTILSPPEDRLSHTAHHSTSISPETSTFGKGTSPHNTPQSSAPITTATAASPASYTTAAPSSSLLDTIDLPQMLSSYSHPVSAYEKVVNEMADILNLSSTASKHGGPLPSSPLHFQPHQQRQYEAAAATALQTSDTAADHAPLTSPLAPYTPGSFYEPIQQFQVTAPSHQLASPKGFLSLIRQIQTIVQQDFLNTAQLSASQPHVSSFFSPLPPTLTAVPMVGRPHNSRTTNTTNSNTSTSTRTDTTQSSRPSRITIRSLDMMPAIEPSLYHIPPPPIIPPPAPHSTPFQHYTQPSSLAGGADLHSRFIEHVLPFTMYSSANNTCKTMFYILQYITRVVIVTEHHLSFLSRHGKTMATPPSSSSSSSSTLNDPLSQIDDDAPKHPLREPPTEEGREDKMGGGEGATWSSSLPPGQGQSRKSYHPPLYANDYEYQRVVPDILAEVLEQMAPLDARDDKSSSDGDHDTIQQQQQQQQHQKDIISAPGDAQPTRKPVMMTTSFNNLYTCSYCGGTHTLPNVLLKYADSIQSALGGDLAAIHPDLMEQSGKPSLQSPSTSTPMAKVPYTYIPPRSLAARTQYLSAAPQETTNKGASLSSTSPAAATTTTMASDRAEQQTEQQTGFYSPLQEVADQQKQAAQRQLTQDILLHQCPVYIQEKDSTHRLFQHAMSPLYGPSSYAPPTPAVSSEYEGHVLELLSTDHTDMQQQQQQQKSTPPRTSSADGPQKGEKDEKDPSRSSGSYSSASIPDDSLSAVPPQSQSQSQSHAPAFVLPRTTLANEPQVISSPSESDIHEHYEASQQLYSSILHNFTADHPVNAQMQMETGYGGRFGLTSILDSLKTLGTHVGRHLGVITEPVQSDNRPQNAPPSPEFIQHRL